MKTRVDRIQERIDFQLRAGAPDIVVAAYAATEALHVIADHIGDAQKCVVCLDATWTFKRTHTRKHKKGEQ